MTSPKKHQQKLHYYPTLFEHECNSKVFRYAVRNVRVVKRAPIWDYVPTNKTAANLSTTASLTTRSETTPPFPATAWGEWVLRKVTGAAKRKNYVPHKHLQECFGRIKNCPKCVNRCLKCGKVDPAYK